MIEIIRGATPRTDEIAKSFMAGGENHHRSDTFEAAMLYEHSRELERELAVERETSLNRLNSLNAVTQGDCEDRKRIAVLEEALRQVGGELTKVLAMIEEKTQ